MSFDAPTLFLIASSVGLAFTLTALIGARRLGPLVFPYFMAAWLTAELAPLHVAWQAIATLIFGLAGAFERWPGWLGLALTCVSWLGMATVWRRSLPAEAALEKALEEGLGQGYRSAIPQARAALLRDHVPRGQWLRPFSFRREGVRVERNIAYGDLGDRHLLDVYSPRDGAGGHPVLLQIHGGAWVSGRKDQQGLPLMYHLAERGWVCVAANYRLGPRVRFPDPLIDCKRALAWTRRHAADYGGDPGFVAVTGGSAGGHLCSLVALTANDPAFQPGFEGDDTRVSAAIPFYGIYDFLDREGVRGSQAMTPFLERYVMPCPPGEDPALWDAVSPVARVHSDAPPFFVIHGSHDSLAYVEDARIFVDALRKVSKSPVVYAEIPGAQHAFDTFHSVRSSLAVNAVTRFLERIYADYARPAEPGASQGSPPAGPQDPVA